ncbi:uncharacterized protein TNCV_3843311 [Trichonephila clavipes]|nr:uncharacterized protein TNCV_3843311 [Trichonephila clavipes]
MFFPFPPLSDSALLSLKRFHPFRHIPAQAPTDADVWVSAVPDDRHTASLVGLRGGWRHARTKLCYTLMDSMLLCPGKGLVLPKINIDVTATHAQVLLLSLPNSAMSQKSPFAIQKSSDCNRRCATVGDSSTDCTLEPKCFNYSQPHSADSKLCPKWKTEKKIQEIKTNRNITYLEAQKLIAPPISQSYAQATKSLKLSATTQTDEYITKRKCPPLKLLQQTSLPKPNVSPSIPSTSASSAQADLLTSTSPKAGIPESEPVSESNTQQRPFHIQYFHFPIKLGCSTHFCLYVNTGY